MTYNLVKISPSFYQQSINNINQQLNNKEQTLSSLTFIFIHYKTKQKLNRKKNKLTLEAR